MNADVTLITQQTDVVQTSINTKSQMLKITFTYQAYEKIISAWHREMLLESVRDIRAIEFDGL